MSGGKKGQTYLTKPAAKRSRFYLRTCDLLLPRGIIGLSACGVVFSVTNLEQTSFLKTTFE